MVWPLDRQRPSPAALGIGLLVLLGVFFRFYDLGEKLLWHDELATRVFAAGYTVDEWQHALYTGEIFDVAEVQKWQRHNPSRSVMDGIRGLAEDDPQHPPLYYVLTRIWVSAFGDGIATLRALSAIFSVLGFLAMYWLARELFASERIAWTSVALYAVSPFFVLYAQEAREYALWTVLILLSNASLLWAIRTTDKKAWALYTLCTILSLYTSFTTASLIICQLLYLCWRERLRPTKVARQAFVALAVAFIAFVPWLVTLIEHFDSFQVTMKWSREIIIPNSALFRILGHNFSRTIVDFWPELVDDLGFFTMVVAVTLIAIAVIDLVRRTPRTSSALIVLVIAFPIGMLLVPDLLYGGIRSISMRYLTPSWLGVLLALGHFLGTPRAHRAWRLLPPAVIGIATLSCALNAPKVTVWTKATSVSLPEVAAAINAEPKAMLVGNLERHSAGNLMALSLLLEPGTKMQFINVIMEEKYVLPRAYGKVFMFNPIPDYRVLMEAREHAKSRLLVQDHFTELWVVDTATTTATTAH